MSRDEAIKKAYEAFIYEHGHLFAVASACLGTVHVVGDNVGKEIASVGSPQDTRPEGSHITISTVTIGGKCDCCEDTPLVRLQQAIASISTGKLPRCHSTSLVLQVDGGVEIVTYGLAELWALRVSLDASGEATGWQEIHVEDSLILPAQDAFLCKNPQFEKGWHFATQSKFQTSLPLQLNNGTAI